MEAIGGPESPNSRCVVLFWTKYVVEDFHVWAWKEVSTVVNLEVGRQDFTVVQLIQLSERW
jgi:hypothetical protein